MTYDPCLTKPHYEKQIIQQMLYRLDIQSHYDLAQCRKCHRWYVVRRPDFGDAA